MPTLPLSDLVYRLDHMKKRPDTRTIGTYEAKTRLPQILREVQAGQRFTITSRGKPVAELSPVKSAAATDAKVAIEAFEAYRDANPVGRRIDIAALIAEGRE